MKSFNLALCVFIVFLLTGCTSSTPINNVVLPPVTTIEGKITKIDENGFILSDNTGSIFVRALIPESEKANYSLDDKVKVFGNLEGGLDKVFDGYVIRKPNGSQLIITNPTPHFGCVIQGSFQ